MDPLRLSLSEASSHRFAQILYRCLEEVGSTKGALYLRAKDGDFIHICHYGWPRGSTPPETIASHDGLLLMAQREKRSFAANELRDFPELTAFGQGGELPRFFITPLYDAGEWVGLLIQRDRLRHERFDLARDEKPTLRIGEDLVALHRELRRLVEAPSAGSLPPEGTAELRATSGTATAAPPPPAVEAPPSVGLIPIVLDLPGAPPPPGQEPVEGFKNSLRATGSFAVLPWEQEQVPLAQRMEHPKPSAEEAEPMGSRKPGKMLPELRAFWWDCAAILHDLVPFDAAALWMDEPDELRPVLSWSAGLLSAGLKQQVLGHLTFLVPDLDQKQLHLVSRSSGRDPIPLDGAFQTHTHLALGEDGKGKDLMLLFRLGEAPFTGKELTKATKLGRVVALQLQEHRIHERYHRAFLSVSHRILKAGEGRHPGLRSHSHATAKLARNLGLWMNLPTLEVEALTIAAVLHDVGLLLLDPGLLAKDGLSTEEFAKVRTHPVLAANFLKDFTFPFEILKLIRHHHERWDGTGYPDGLSGKTIPMGSRIIAVVDAYAAMIEGYGGRRPLSPAQAVDELRAGAATQFDAEVVDPFCAMLRRPEEEG